MYKICLQTNLQTKKRFFFIIDLPTSQKWSQCQFCKLVITTVNLWRHIRTQHTPQPPQRCNYCKKTFKNKYSLREHVRMAHEQKHTVLAQKFWEIFFVFLVFFFEIFKEIWNKSELLFLFSEFLFSCSIWLRFIDALILGCIYFNRKLNIYYVNSLLELPTLKRANQ